MFEQFQFQQEYFVNSKQPFPCVVTLYFTIYRMVLMTLWLALGNAANGFLFLLKGIFIVKNLNFSSQVSRICYCVLWILILQVLFSYLRHEN